jgi:hypothetical protein
MRRRLEPHKPADNMNSLRSAFVYDVRPDAYLSNVAWTSVLTALVMAGMLVWHNESIMPLYLVPFDGWHARNPDGQLYVELWANIIANALQIGFGFWAAILFLLGLGRLLFARKFVQTCFTLGAAFLVACAVSGLLTQIVFQWLTEKYPILLK